jgi:hypothetical protein
MKKLLLVFVSLMTFVSTSHSAYCILNDGRRGTVTIIDTLSVYDPLETVIRFKSKNSTSTQRYTKQSIKFLIINSDTICYNRSTAIHPDGTPYQSQMLTNREEEYSRSEIGGKLATYTKMRGTGIGLLLTGTALTVGGILLMSSAEWTTIQTETGIQKNTNDPQGAIGIVMLLPGIPLTLTGMILTGIGSSKVAEYQKRARRLSVGGCLGREYCSLFVRSAF